VSGVPGDFYALAKDKHKPAVHCSIESDRADLNNNLLIWIQQSCLFLNPEYQVVNVELFHETDSFQ